VDSSSSLSTSPWCLAEAADDDDVVVVVVEESEACPVAAAADAPSPEVAFFFGRSFLISFFGRC